MILCKRTFIAVLTDFAAFYAVISVALAAVVAALLTDRTMLKLLVGTVKAVMAIIAYELKIVTVFVAYYKAAVFTGFGGAALLAVMALTAGTPFIIILGTYMLAAFVTMITFINTAAYAK